MQQPTNNGHIDLVIDATTYQHWPHRSCCYRWGPVWQLSPLTTVAPAAVTCWRLLGICCMLHRNWYPAVTKNIHVNMHQCELHIHIFTHIIYKLLMKAEYSITYQQRKRRKCLKDPYSTYNHFFMFNHFLHHLSIFNYLQLSSLHNSLSQFLSTSESPCGHEWWSTNSKWKELVRSHELIHGRMQAKHSSLSSWNHQSDICLSLMIKNQVKSASYELSSNQHASKA